VSQLNVNAVNHPNNLVSSAIKEKANFEVADPDSDLFDPEVPEVQISDV
ncbi:uncharacterized protein METZ01_LOCUS69428, partial [marine metagenome]